MPRRQAENPVPIPADPGNSNDNGVEICPKSPPGTILDQKVHLSEQNKDAMALPQHL